MTDVKLKELLSKLHPEDNRRGVIRKLQAAGLTFRKDFDVAEGAYKLCIDFKDYPCVIKWMSTPIDDESANAIQEVIYYNLAVEAGVEDFFPQTELFCEINNIAFMKQKKVPVYLADINAYPDIKDKIESLNNETIDINILGELYDVLDCPVSLAKLWCIAAVAIYGKQKCEELCHFVNENCIDDLHEKNIGFIGIHPTILDFTGYW